jgi:Cu2+-exporting ATPase/Cu+-exporting ATPase
MTCDLCGEDASRGPLARRIGENEKRFCCIGCMNVYVILFESGIVASGQDLRSTDLFRRSLAMGLISKRGDAGARPVAAPSGETRELLVQVSGMWCSACAWLIEHSLEAERRCAGRGVVCIGSRESGVRPRARRAGPRAAH